MNLTGFLNRYADIKQLRANEQVWQVPDKVVRQILNQIGGTSVEEGFFNGELVELAEELLQIQDFKTCGQDKVNLKFEQVVGFAQPLWLGGNDEPENYQLIDAKIEWEINRQLKKTIKG